MIGIKKKGQRAVRPLVLFFLVIWRDELSFAFRWNCVFISKGVLWRSRKIRSYCFSLFRSRLGITCPVAPFLSAFN